jgi:hypothetical protein
MMGPLPRRSPSLFRLTLGCLALLVAGCGRLSDGQAAKVVEGYDRGLIEAYRASDPQLLAGVAGTREHDKVATLIGAKQDMGLFLDAEILEMKVIEVARGKSDVVVITDERWHYRDRRIGKAEQVGAESTDHYRMRYLLEKEGGKWVVGQVEFGAAPEVGRAEAPTSGPLSSFHAFAPAAADGGTKP